MSTILPPPPPVPMDVLLLVVEEQLSDLHMLCGGPRLSPSSSDTVRPSGARALPPIDARRTSSQVHRVATGLDEEDTHGSAESADRTNA
jgi:hypothetical protein